MFKLWLPLFLTFCIQNSASEVFSSNEHLKELLKIEEMLLNTTTQYIKNLTQHLVTLQKYESKLTKKQKYAKKNMDNYIKNPINAFKLIKRLIVDRKYIGNIIKNNLLYDSIADDIFQLKNIPNKPEFVDLKGAAVSMNLLKTTYDLSLKDMSKGYLGNVQYNAKLSSKDCFEIGRQMFLEKDYYSAIDWIREGYNKVGNKKEKKKENYFIKTADYIIGNISKIVKYDKRVTRNENELESLQTHVKIYQAIKVSGMKNKPLEHKSFYPDYKKLCKGEKMLQEDVKSRLKCKYFHGNDNKFLMIAPFKVEELVKDPEMLLYYNVLMDSEIEELKNIARSKLASSRAFSKERFDISTYRTSQTAWISLKDHQIGRDILTRAADMTGLSMEDEGELQVVNYGIGGHYGPHLDNIVDKKYKTFDDSIVTILFYMSEVEKGGSTVFPNAWVEVKTVKNSAVVWYNLHSSGDIDIRSLHASCPVLYGDKWVSNLWIKEKTQQFTKPCISKPPKEYVL